MTCYILNSNYLLIPFVLMAIYNVAYEDAFAALVASDAPLVVSLRADAIALTPAARRRLRRAS